MARITVGDLLDMLQEYDPSTPILLAHQPSWPLAETLAGVVHDDDLPHDEEQDPDDVVWLVAGGHPFDRSPYAPKGAFEVSGVAW